MGNKSSLTDCQNKKMKGKKKQWKIYVASSLVSHSMDTLENEMIHLKGFILNILVQQKHIPSIISEHGRR